MALIVNSRTGLSAARRKAQAPVTWQPAPVTGWTLSAGGYVATCATPGSSLFNHAVVTNTLPTTGKWYWEVILTDEGPNQRPSFGFPPASLDPIANNNDRVGLSGALANVTAVYAAWNGLFYQNNVSTGDSGLGGASDGDVLRFAWDADTGRWWYGLNGAWSGDPAGGTGYAFAGLTSGPYHFAAGNGNYDPATPDVLTLRTATSGGLTHASPAGFGVLA